jgi:ComF family protein
MALLENFTNPLLIPIPISKKRYRERGYNQSLLVCKELIRIDKENFDLESSVLIKNKETEHQARIKNRNERLKNIIGSFETKNENKIKNRNIILIDDITTTGATLNEAKKILKESGAKKIIAFTVAH